MQQGERLLPRQQRTSDRIEFAADLRQQPARSGHSDTRKLPEGRIWGRGGRRECLLSAKSGHWRSLGGRQAFELLEPVLDHDDSRGRAALRSGQSKQIPVPPEVLIAIAASVEPS